MLTQLLAEQPVLLSILLGVLAAACFYAWLQTAHKAGLIAAVVCLLLIPGTWYLAERWVTDREQIEGFVYRTAAAVERNEFEEIYRLIDPSRTETLQRARSELPKYKFSKAKVGQFRSLKFTKGAIPPEAVVDLTVSADVELKTESIPQQHIARRVVLRFEKKNDRWYVTDYTHLPPIGGPDGFTPSSRLNDMLQ